MHRLSVSLVVNAGRYATSQRFAQREKEDEEALTFKDFRGTRRVARGET